MYAVLAWVASCLQVSVHAPAGLHRRVGSRLHSHGPASAIHECFERAPALWASEFHHILVTQCTAACVNVSIAKAQQPVSC